MKYFLCKGCGKPFERESRGRCPIYCKGCRVEANKERSIQHYYNNHPNSIRGENNFMDIAHNRRGEMVLLREAGVSFEKIGNRYGITRQRAQQVISGYQVLNRSLARGKGGYRTIHKAVLLRDNNTCQVCVSTNGLIVHHRDKDNSNNKLSNLITLCRSCHQKEHILGVKRT